MQGNKALCSLPSRGNIFLLDFFKFSLDSVESTESIESKANYGKTRMKNVTGYEMRSLAKLCSFSRT